MKSPEQLSLKLRKQWNNAKKRELRLLGGAAGWPITESIGRPKPATIATDLDAVRQHIQVWGQVKTGEVIWEEVSYRATAEPVKVPCKWQLNKPSEWIDACRNQAVQQEFRSMEKLVSNAATEFHSLLIRRPSLWQNKPLDEVLLACSVAAELSPGFANGKPLRTLSVTGIDTKFFERHARLVTRLLDQRFEDEVSRIGLEAFLGALYEGDHWILLVDLDGGLLPFKRQRVSTADLVNAALPGSRLLIVENESCLHQLPPVVDNTLAILGAGFDLDWTGNSTLQNKAIGYWGDIDTWGLNCLAKARQNQPGLQSLLMEYEHFVEYQQYAVVEPVVAGTQIPEYLIESEKLLYQTLLNSEAGRLEQEYLPVNVVHDAIARWWER